MSKKIKEYDIEISRELLSTLEKFMGEGHIASLLDDRFLECYFCDMGAIRLEVTLDGFKWEYEASTAKEHFGNIAYAYVKCLWGDFSLDYFGINQDIFAEEGKNRFFVDGDWFEDLRAAVISVIKNGDFQEIKEEIEEIFRDELVNRHMELSIRFGEKGVQSEK